MPTTGDEPYNGRLIVSIVGDKHKAMSLEMWFKVNAVVYSTEKCKKSHKKERKQNFTQIKNKCLPQKCISIYKNTINFASILFCLLSSKFLK